MLEGLTETVSATGDRSLLARRPEDWQLLIRNHLADRFGQRTFDTTIAPYLRTFFSTLHRSLICDPWAEDIWLWRGSFDRILGVSDDRYEQNIRWTNVELSWLRRAAKQLAKRSLITKERAWSTIVGWTRGLNLFSQYLLQEGIEDPELLDRELFLDYLTWIREHHGSKTNLQMVNTVATILETLRSEELVPELATSVYLRRGENAVEKVRHPKPYPADVLDRVDTKVIPDPELDQTVRTMLLLNRWGGLRISELVILPLDCLRHNDKGGYWIEYWMTKTKSWRRFPVPADLAEQLRDQQERVVTRYGQAAKHMFPSPARSNARQQIVHPWSSPGFRKHIRTLFAKHGIESSTITGEKITGGEIHRYRHTVGTVLLNNNWTQREVQDFLGHCSPTMTSCYAEILDETLNRKAEEFHRNQAAQQPHSRSNAQLDPKVERLRAKFTTVLSNGFCMLPADKICDFRPTPCLKCAFFDPGEEEYAAVHANHRKQLRLFLADNDDPAKAALNQPMLDAVEALSPANDEAAS